MDYRTRMINLRVEKARKRGLAKKAEEGLEDAQTTIGEIRSKMCKILEQKREVDELLRRLEDFREPGLYVLRTTNRLEEGHKFVYWLDKHVSDTVSNLMAFMKYYLKLEKMVDKKYAEIDALRSGLMLFHHDIDSCSDYEDIYKIKVPVTPSHWENLDAEEKFCNKLKATWDDLDLLGDMKELFEDIDPLRREIEALKPTE